MDDQGGSVPPPSEAELLPLDGLAVLSVIAKWQGNVNNWAPYLDEASKRGYNMLHFTPLQTRGESGSPYSIKEQLKFDPELFHQGTGQAGDGVKEITKIITECREKYGLLSLTDVVLNHTANDSPWLEEHPESGTLAFFSMVFPFRLLITRLGSTRLQRCQLSPPGPCS